MGQGVLFAGNTHVAIQIVASANEHTIITTKPEEVMKRKQAEKDKEKKEQAKADDEQGAQNKDDEVIGGS